MAGRLLTGRKEVLRAQAMELVKRGLLTIRAAAKEPGVSYRQGRRMEGAKGLHGNAGKPSNRKIAEYIRERAPGAYRERYNGFGPAFAAEKLAETEGIRVSEDTLRRWMIAEGLWEGKRRGRAYRSRRERRPGFGCLPRFDGSRRDRSGGRGAKCCLITMIDGAANTRYSRSSGEETTAGAMAVLSCRIKTDGVPQPCIAAAGTPLR